MQLPRDSHKLQSALVFFLGALLTPCVFAESKGVAYISNQNGKVTVIDLETMEVKGEINNGAKGPRGIGVTADGKWLVTANKDDSNISIVDLSRVSQPKLVSIGKNPEFVRILGNRGYVTYEPASKGGPPLQKTSDAKKMTTMMRKKSQGILRLLIFCKEWWLKI
jgi:hypothetical protein